MSAKGTFENLEKNGWTEIARMLDEKEPESLHLDFKCVDGKPGPALSDDDLARVAKAASAFANVEGGVLVLGIKTSTSGKDEPDRAASSRPIENVQAAAGVLDRRIARLTDPPIPGTRVLPIHDPAHATRGVLALYIPQTDGGPHQAAFGVVESRYFMRTSTNSTPAPHSILAGMFGRRPLAKLRLAARKDPLNRIVLYVLNEGRGLAENTMLRVTIRMKDGSTQTHSGMVDGQWEHWKGGALKLDHYALTFTHKHVLHADDSSPAYAFESAGYKDGVQLRGRLDAKGMAPVFFDQLVVVTYETTRIAARGDDTDLVPPTVSPA